MTTVYNYLKLPCTLQSVKGGNINIKIEPGKIAKIKLLEKGMVLHVKVNSEPFAEINILDIMKYLHIGMVTTRIQEGGGDDGFAMGYAIQGRPWLKIHNQTDLTLCFNGPQEEQKIIVNPHSFTRYKGKYHMGVPLGFKLISGNKAFDDITLIKPVSDIYYGVIADIPQAIYGESMWGTQMSTRDNEQAYVFNRYSRFA